MLRFPWALALLAAACVSLRAASVTGNISDSSGAALTGATVTARNVDTAVEFTTRTTDSGSYEIDGLQAGTYSVTASFPQFTTVGRMSVLFRVGDRLRIDLSLMPGASAETISVTGTAPLLQIDTSTVSSVVNLQAVEDLPSNGRQLQNFALLVPGVTAGWNTSTLANRYGKARENTEGAFAVNGARSRSNDFIFDGAPLNLRQYNVINFEPSNEAVQEFQVITSIPPPEFGRATGGIVNIITRAGGSQFHGSAYEFFRNDKLDANSTFNTRAGLPRGRVRQNQFGGTLGGPIYRDRGFLFLNAEIGRNIESSETRLTSVPTADERNGLIVFNNAAGVPQTLNLASRITPLSRSLLALYPQPNTSAGNGLNYNTPLPIALTDYQYTARTDHHLTARDILTVRTSWNLNDQVYVINRFGGPFVPGFSLPNPESTTNGTLSYFHTFAPALANEAHLGVNRYSNLLGNGDTGSASAIGLPNGDSANGIPTIAFTAGRLEGLGGASFFNRTQNELSVFFGDGVTYLRGNHHFKFGGEVSRFQFNTRGATNERGTVSFDGSQNGLIPQTPPNARASALADLLLGLPFSATITTGQFGRGYRDWVWSIYAQDNWRASNRLTLNYGLRYDYAAPWSEVNGKLSNFVPGRGVVAGPLYQSKKDNFGPRIGLAYDLNGNSRSILRAGFGIRYDTQLQASTVQQIENNPPYSAAAVTFAPAPFSRGNSPSRTLLDLRGSALPSNSISALPGTLNTPEVLQASLSIQQVIGQSWVVEAVYQYTRGLSLPVNYNIGQVPIDSLTAEQRDSIQRAAATSAGTLSVLDPLRPFAGFNSINLFNNVAGSTYNSLELKIERRFRSGLNLLAAYTWSKSIDNATDFASGDSSEQVLDANNLRNQRGPSSFDVTNRFTGAVNYSIPFPSTRLEWLARGWQLNGLLTFQGGQPFTPYTSRFDPFRNENYNRLEVVGDPNRNVPSGDAYNPAAFAEPALGTFGVSGRNIVRGGGYRGVDVSLFRNLRISGQVGLQLRFEAANSFNYVNYQGPSTNQTSSPGQFLASAPPRQLQLGAKITF